MERRVRRLKKVVPPSCLLDPSGSKGRLLIGQHTVKFNCTKRQMGQKFLKVTCPYNKLLQPKYSTFFSSFWVSLSLSLILDDAPEVGDPPALWSKLDAKGLLLLPLRSRLDRELLILLRVLVMPLVWRRDRTGLSRRSSKMGALSTVCSSQEAQSGILLSWLYRSLVTERSARTSRAPNIAPGRTVLLLEW